MWSNFVQIDISYLFREDWAEKGMFEISRAFPHSSYPFPSQETRPSDGQDNVAYFGSPGLIKSQAEEAPT